MQTVTCRLANGAEGALSVRLSLMTVRTDAAGTRPYIKEGFKFTGRPTASADRRTLRLKLTEQSVAVIRANEAEGGGAEKQPDLGAQPAEVKYLGATSSTVVADGGTVIFRLAYAPKDKVWVVAIRPTIVVAAEEEMLQKQRLEEKLLRVFPRGKSGS